MKPEEILKQFKLIEADRDFVKKSRRLILISGHAPRMGFLGVVFRTIELGASVALVSLAIFMILGGFSSSRVLSPLQISNLDPNSIKAEAHAIDMQIELSNLNYKEGALAPKTSESTPSVPQNSAGKTSEPSQVSPAATSSTPQPVGVDEALDKLSE
jgi:hypothetical protein